MNVHACAQLCSAASRSFGCRHLLQKSARAMYSDRIRQQQQRRPARSPCDAVAEKMEDPASLLQEFDSVLMKKGTEGHSVTTRQIWQNGLAKWSTEISVPWPELLTVNAVSPSKKVALADARARMCNILQERGVLSSASCTKQLERKQDANKGSGFVEQLTRAVADAVEVELRRTQAGTMIKSGAVMPLPVLHQAPDMNGNIAAQVSSKRLSAWTEKRELSRAKSVVHNIYAYVCKLKGSALMPSYVTVLSQTNFAFWTCTLAVKWPCNLSFEGRARIKKEAEALAASHLLEYLVTEGHVDRNLNPKTCSDRELRKRMSQRTAPVPVVLLESSVSAMRNLVMQFETVVSNAPHLPDDVAEEDLIVETESSGSQRTIYDIMTGRILTVSSEFQPQKDKELMTKLERTSQYTSAMQQARQALPISPHRENIVRTVERNRVVVVCGETGSGKTTQVPQFILEEFIRRGDGSACNIVVTQPRRMAAISIAKRVAKERGEELGRTVGFQVRLAKELLSSRGGVLFCTVGILLQHLKGNPQLRGVSHVIVDEVHERDVCTDFLLVLLQGVVELNRDLRVVLMSATINVEKFSEYFGGAPIIRIPGKMHPVTQYFLDDLTADNIVSQDALRKAAFDPVRIVPQVLTFIMETKPPGAVLCFLPGWSEITWVRNELCKVVPPKFHNWILPLHSQLRYQEQQRIFATPPSDVRKVILCTNLAETSITVDDVVYVVDAGLQREQRFYPSTGISLLGTFPTSQASARQRMGRAGRLRPGESFHLYTRADLASRDQFAQPEMQTVDLTKVVLDCKLFCPARNAKDILMLAPDPPAPERIEKAIKDLHGMSMMDGNEELTDLGHYVIHFTTAPQLAKAIIYSALFGCLDPVVAVAAVLSESSKLFDKDTNKTGKGKEVKAGYEQTLSSDHVALSRIFHRWKSLGDPDDQQAFCRRNALNAFCLELSNGQGQEHVSQLMRCMRVDPVPSAGEKEWGIALNSNSDHFELILAVLTAGLYPNVLRVLDGRIVEFACLDQRRATVSEESLLHRVRRVYEHPWLVYYSALQPSKYQLTTTYDCSMVSSLHLLLFAGQGVHIIEDYIFDARSQAPAASNQACLVIDEQQLLTFRCSKRDADLIWRWRRMLDYMLNLHLSLDVNIEPCVEETYLRRTLWPQIVHATATLLAQHQSGRHE